MKTHTEARLQDAVVDSPTRKGGFAFVDYRTGPTAGRYNNALEHLLHKVYRSLKDRKSS